MINVHQVCELSRGGKLFNGTDIFGSMTALQEAINAYNCPPHYHLDQVLMYDGAVEPSILYASPGIDQLEHYLLNYPRPRAL